MRWLKPHTLGASPSRSDGQAVAGPRLVRRFIRDRSGSSAIEFAILAAPFFGFIVFIMQVGLFHFSQQSLDFATRKAARQIMTGSLPSGARSLAGFKTTMICPSVLWKTSCDSFIVNAYKVAKTSDSAAGTGIYAFVDAKTKTLAGPQTDPKQTSFCLGGPGDYIFLDIAYPFPDFTGGLFSASGSMFQLRSTSFIYNEPFAGGGSTC